MEEEGSGSEKDEAPSVAKKRRNARGLPSGQKKRLHGSGLTALATPADAHDGGLAAWLREQAALENERVKMLKAQLTSAEANRDGYLKSAQDVENLAAARAAAAARVAGGES